MPTTRRAPTTTSSSRASRARSRSLGWVGFAFYSAEEERMKAIEIDAGDGCVAPTPETIADGSYPFSRSLYIYVNTANADDNPAVASYVDLYLSREGLATVAEAGYVDLPEDRITATTGGLGRPLTPTSPRLVAGRLPPRAAGHDRLGVTCERTLPDADRPGPPGQRQAAQPRAPDARRLPGRRRGVDRHQPADPVRAGPRGDQLPAADRLGLRAAQRHRLVPPARALRPAHDRRRQRRDGRRGDARRRAVRARARRSTCPSTPRAGSAGSSSRSSRCWPASRR